MPAVDNEFLRIAGQQLAAAETLLKYGYNLDAMYLGGYAVECSLKALILHCTPGTQYSEKLKKITRGKKMHSIDVLAGELEILGNDVPKDLLRKLSTYNWSTNLRYELGRRAAGHVRGFIKIVKHIVAWVEKHLP